MAKQAPKQVLDRIIRTLLWSLGAGTLGLFVFWIWMALLAMDNPASRAVFERAVSGEGARLSAWLFFMTFALAFRWIWLTTRK